MFVILSVSINQFAILKPPDTPIAYSTSIFFIFAEQQLTYIVLPNRSAVFTASAIVSIISVSLSSISKPHTINNVIKDIMASIIRKGVIVPCTSISDSCRMYRASCLWLCHRLIRLLSACSLYKLIV